MPESLGGGSFKTSYCAPLSFGLVNQNLGRSPCRLDISMTCRLVDCRHPRGLRTSALGDTFHASNAIPPPPTDEPQFIEINPLPGFGVVVIGDPGCPLPAVGQLTSQSAWTSGLTPHSSLSA